MGWSLADACNVTVEVVGPVDPTDLEGPMSDDPDVASRQLVARLRADVEKALLEPAVWPIVDLGPAPPGVRVR